VTAVLDDQPVPVAVTLNGDRVSMRFPTPLQFNAGQVFTISLA